MHDGRRIDAKRRRMPSVLDVDEGGEREVLRVHFNVWSVGFYVYVCLMFKKTPRSFSIAFRFAPYNLDKARNPINEGVDKSTWCPIVNNYSPNSRNQRSKWGFCHCVDASDFQKQGVEDGIFNRAVAGMKSLSQMGKSIVTKGQKVSEAGLEAKEEICFTSSLSTSPQKSVRCASSFRIGNKGKFGSGCISMGSVRPWGANKSLPASTLWCPTIPTYVKSSRAKRSKWGICECTPGPAYAVAAVKANAVLDLLSLLPSERRTAFWDAI